MKYKELVHWPRKCPKCGTTFQSVQELGRCPECEHLFKADSSGVAYIIEKEHPALGIIESFAAKEDKEAGAREWSIKRFERLGDDPERYISVVGDRSGPQARSFDDILEISERCDEIEGLILDKIYGDPKEFPFAPKITEFCVFDICFFDRDDSTHYSACLQYGVFELVLEMRGLEFVGLFPEKAKETTPIAPWIIPACLVSVVLLGAAVAFGIIKLVGLL